MSTSTYDILIIGGGPAGLAAAAALSGPDRSVGHIAPSQPPEWPHSYGLWIDDIEGLSFLDGSAADLFEGQWSNIAVDTGGDSARYLPGVYGRLDNKKAIEVLRRRADSGGVDWIDAWVRAVATDDQTIDVMTKSGDRYRGRLVLDATGHQSKFVGRPDEAADRVAHQTAWGAWIDCEPAPVRGTDMMLMDFGDDYLQEASDADVGDPRLPTFLYAMRRHDGTWFVEETSLAARPAIGFDVLEARLRSRLAHRGVEIRQQLDTERVRIPMGGPIPHLDQSIVGLGGAAAMPHPATGYMVARTWRRIDELSRNLDKVLETDSLDTRARRAWRTIWPEESVRARHLYNFGLETLLSMDAGATRRFFATFFELDEQDWRAYLNGDASPGRLAGIMWRMFRSAPMSTKVKIARASITGRPSELWRGWRG